MFAPSQLYVTSSHLGSNIILSILFSNSLCSSLQVRQRGAYPEKYNTLLSHTTDQRELKQHTQHIHDEITTQNC
jgi:hypothetical protein